MAFVTKTWKDRLVEYAGRRKLKNVATGEEVLMDVSRSEGTVSQAGDAFSAANMNNLEQRIKNEFDTVNSSLTNLGIKQTTVAIQESNSIGSLSYKDFTISISELGFTEAPSVVGFYSDWFVVKPLSITKNELVIRVYNPTSKSMWGTVVISLAIVK